MEYKSEYSRVLLKFQILTFFIFVSHFVVIHGTFNMIDVKNSKIIRNPTGRNGDFFGYSVAFVKGKQKTILVGAPKSSSTYQSTVTRPGALYKCPSVTSCQEVRVNTTGNIQETLQGRQLWHHKDNRWLGVSLDVSAAVLVCAHRWIDQYDLKTTGQGDFYMDGFCYEFNNDLERVTPTPLLSVRPNSSLPSYFENAAMGMSAEYSKTQSEYLLLGAPGLNQYAGGFVKVGNSQNKFTNPIDPIGNADLYGYAVTSGHYYDRSTTYIAIGGPRDDLTGKVMIKTENYVTKENLKGEQIGSYFGAVLCTVVHKDFGDMLLIGAPFYGSVNSQTINSNTEEGKVYVYIREGSHLVLRQVLSGSKSESARFGSAIADIQDINRDTYHDVAIGAPFEDEGKGVVYIYNGNSGSSGIWQEFNQRIAARELGTTLSSFGSVISRKQMTFSNEFYADILVGAYMSDSAVLLVSSPPITLDIKSTVSKKVIDKDTDKEFILQVCFGYPGSTNLPSDIRVKFTAKADVERIKQSKVPRVYFSVNDQRKFSVTNETKIFKILNTTCTDSPYTVKTVSSITDIVTPIHFEIEYTIIGKEGFTNAIINRFDGRRLNPTEDKAILSAEFMKKGCGDENVCDADLTSKAEISYNFGSSSLLVGEKAGFALDVTISNKGEPSYDTQVIITFPLYITYQQYKLVNGERLTCSPGYNQTTDMNTVECGMSKPLLGGQSVRFNVKLDASDITPEARGFNVTIKAHTRSSDVNKGNNDVVLPVMVKSKADLVFNSISSPEIFVTKAYVGKWQVLQHRFDLENKGPSPLVSGTMFKIYFPLVIINNISNLFMNQSLISVTNGFITKVDCETSQVRLISGSGTSSSTTYRIIPINNKVQTNVLDKDCSKDKCEFMSCQVQPIPEQSSVSISLTFMMAPDFFSTLKAGNDELKSVDIVSKVMVSLPSNQRLERDSLVMQSSTGTEILPSKPIVETIEWWKILLCVLGGIGFIVIVVFVAYKFGFFRRKSKEKLEKKQKETAEEKALNQDQGMAEEATFEKPEYLENEPISVAGYENYVGPIDDTIGSNDEKSLVEKPPMRETDIQAEVYLDDHRTECHI